MFRLTPWGVVEGGLARTPSVRSDAAAVRRRHVARRHSRWFWLGLWAAALAAAFGALVPALVGWVAPVPLSELVFRLAGVSFAGCGLIAWRRRQDSNVGPLMTFAGFALFAYPLASLTGSDLWTTLATLFANAWTIAFATLVLTFTTGGRLESPVDRLIIGVAFFALFVLQVVRLLFAPYPENRLQVWGDLGVFTTVGDIQFVLAILVSLAIVAVIAARWRRATPPGRRALQPSVAGCLCSLTFSAVLLCFLVTRSIPEWLSLLSNAALLTVPAAFLVGMLRSRLARGGLAALFRDLGSLRGEQLQAGLASSLRDPDLVLAYRDGAGFRDVHGTPLAVPSPGRAVATVERNGRELGALLYDPLLDDDPELVHAVSAAAALALDDERVQAEAAAAVAELRASRERVIAAGDTERRRLERNLHDGAQQRLVAVRMQLGLLQGRVQEDPVLASQVAAAREEILHSLDELRELARGLHPAVLDQGLAVALESLAARSAVPTRVIATDVAGMSESAQLAAYFVACEALANIAKYAMATQAYVSVERRRGLAVIEIVDDGVGGADESAGTGLRGLADRVAAVEGSLRISSPPGHGTVVRAEFPCDP